MNRFLIVTRFAIQSIGRQVSGQQVKGLILMVGLLLPFAAPIPAWAYDLNTPPAPSQSTSHLTAEPSFSTPLTSLGDSLLSPLAALVAPKHFSPSLTPKHAGAEAGAVTTELEKHVVSIETLIDDRKVFKVGEIILLSGIPLDKDENPVNGLSVKWETATPDTVRIINDSQAIVLKPGEARLKAVTGTVNREILIAAVAGGSESTEEPAVLNEEQANELVQPRNNVGNVIGQMDASSLWSGSTNTVDTVEKYGSSNFGFSVPLASLSGRGINAGVGMTYNSRVWHKTYVHPGQRYLFNLNNNWLAPGFEVGFGSIETYSVAYLLTKPDGSRTLLGPPYNEPFNGCGMYQSNDGTFIRAKRCGAFEVQSTMTVKYPDGTEAVYERMGNSRSSKRYPIKITDRNGNFINIVYLPNDTQGKIAYIQDTLNRYITFHYDSTSEKKLVAITVPGLIDGSATRRQTIRFYYEDVPLNWEGRFESNVPVTAPTTIKVLRHIYFPGTQAGYRYEYSQYFGMIYKISQRFGMQVSTDSLEETGNVVSEGSESAMTHYNYAASPEDIPNPLTEVPTYTWREDDWLGRTTTSRPRTSFHIEESISGNPGIGTRTTTVTSPDGSKTISVSKVNQDPYNGWDNGLLLELRKVTIVNGEERVWTKTKNDWRPRFEHEYYRKNARIIKTEITNDAGQTRATEFEYDIYNNPTVVREYDIAPEGTLGTELRRTETTYETGSGWKQAGLLRLPKQIQKFVDSNIVSKSVIEYDNYSVSPLADTPEVMQHSSRFNPYNPPASSQPIEPGDPPNSLNVENQPPGGFPDEVRENAGVWRASGYAWDPDQPNLKVLMYFYMDGPAGQGSFIGSQVADKPSYTAYPDHGFDFAIPSQYYNGQQHSVYIYARDTTNGSLRHLYSSPKTFTAAPPPIEYYRGNVTKVISFPNTAAADNDPANSISTMKYDITGNVVEASSSCCNVQAIQYDLANGYAYPISETKGSGSEQLTTSVTYSRNTGLVKTATDENGQTTTLTYDPLSLRLTRADSPNGAWSTTDYNDTQFPFYVKSTSSLDGNRSVSSWSFKNGAGQAFRRRSLTASGYLSADVEFDSAGRVKKSYNPYTVAALDTPRPGGIKFTEVTKRDELERVLETTLQDGSKVKAYPNEATITYTSPNGRPVVGTVSRVEDQAGKERRQIVDALGRIARVDEPIDNPPGSDPFGPLAVPYQPTYYEYDGNNNLSRVIQSDGIVTQERLFVYDSLSRLIRERQVEARPKLDADGNHGSESPTKWTGVYKYTSDGLLDYGVDARGVKSDLFYDGLNRVKKVEYSGDPGYSTPTVNYTYDEPRTDPVLGTFYNKGRPTTIATQEINITGGQFTPKTIQKFDYDKAGQVVNHNQTIDQQNYNLQYGYNLAGQLTSEKYPSGKVVNMTIDSFGVTQTITDSQRTFLNGISATYDAEGMTSQVTLGNGTSETFRLNERFQLTSQSLKRGAEVIQKFDYAYGQIDGSGDLDATKNNGQLAKIEAFIGAAKQRTQKFTYDSIGRLKQSAEYRGDTNALTYKQVFDFDRFGNLYRKDSSNPIGGQQNPIPFTRIEESTTAELGDIDKTTNKFRTETTYNDAGQVIQDDKFRDMGFAYDANGRAVKATKLNTPDATTVYDAVGNRVATKINGVWHYMIYDAFGQLVAEYGAPSEGLGGVKYVQQDHQGSVRTVTNSNGFVVARTDHQGFGETIGSGVGLRNLGQGYGDDVPARKGYGLTETDESSGQQHTWFRKLETKASRWSSPDPYKGSMKLGNPQSFNRYSYVTNDPVNKVDPSGLDECNGTIMTDTHGNTFCVPHPTGTVTVNGALDDWSLFSAGLGMYFPMDAENEGEFGSSVLAGGGDGPDCPNNVPEGRQGIDTGRALMHYQAGDGTPMNLNIKNLMATVPGLNSFSAVQRAIDKGTRAPFQQIPIAGATSDPVATSGDQAGWLGRVTFNLTGVLNLYATGDYQFYGTIGVNPDLYDFDKDTADGRQRRTIAASISTWIGSQIPGKAFKININGRFTLDVEGNRSGVTQSRCK